MIPTIPGNTVRGFETRSPFIPSSFLRRGFQTPMALSPPVRGLPSIGQPYHTEPDATALPSSALGEWSLESAARSLGTDPKSLLLFAGGGLVAGYLLNDLWRSARRGGRKVGRKLGKAFNKPKTVSAPTKGVSVGSLLLAALAAGGAYYLYREYQAGKLDAHAAGHAPSRVDKPTAQHVTPLPRLVGGHWQRPA